MGRLLALLALPLPLPLPLAGLGCGGAAFSAAPDGGAQGTTDGGAEGSTEDAPAGDGALDAGGPGTWCSSQTSHFFCDDFDTLPLPSNFARVNTSGNGVLSYDTAVFQSPPNALLATTPLAVATNASAVALLSKSFLTRDGSHVVTQMDLQIAAQCALGANTVSPLGFLFPEYAMVLIATAPGNGSLGAELIELTLGADGGPTGDSVHMLRTALPFDQWFTVVVDAQLGSSARLVDVTVAGKPALTSEKLNLEPATAPQHPTLLVGASSNSAPGGTATTGCTVRVDNVLLDIRLL